MGTARIAHLLGALALLLGGCAGAPASIQGRPAGSPEPTQLRVFQAWQSDGRLAEGLRAASIESDLTCDAATVADGALRCLFGSSLRQPCFVSPQDRRSVACISSPWEPDAVVGALAQPVAGAALRGTEVTKGRMWAAELDEDIRCRFTTGATQVVQGRRLDYTCGAGAGWGDPDRSHPAWTLAYARGDTQPPDSFETRPIRVAWF